MNYNSNFSIIPEPSKPSDAFNSDDEEEGPPQKFTLTPDQIAETNIDLGGEDTVWIFRGHQYFKIPTTDGQHTFQKVASKIASSFQNYLNWGELLAASFGLD